MIVPEAGNDVRAFLSVLAALLLDNTLRLEETAGRVTELIMSSGRPDREMVVTLQSFDRLKQEFEALGDALARYAESANALPQVGEDRHQLGREVIATIVLADLKDRLLTKLQGDLPTMSSPPMSEADVDVKF